MALHLLKLAVGVESVADLETRIKARLKARRAAGEKRPQPVHRTRMVPRRQEELLDGGSLYWVVRGQIAARQEIRGIEPFTDEDGVGRCFIVLDKKVTPVAARRMRPFQGWRYLTAADAPADIAAGHGESAAMPEELRRELRTLGLL
ncbi:MAG: DUF1489 family protein [Beijerinckiaceae bacterium]